MCKSGLNHNTFRFVDQIEKLLLTSVFRAAIKNKISEQSLDEFLHEWLSNSFWTPNVFLLLAGTSTKMNGLTYLQ